MKIKDKLECMVGAMASLVALVGARPAAAQPEAPEQHAEEAPAEPPEDNTTSWAASLGGTHNAGNTESWQVTASSDFRLVRGPHGFGASATFNYGRANVPEDDSDQLQDTMKNFLGKVRYDYFLTPRDAVFVAERFRWDQFAGLDARAQSQIGYLRVLFQAEKHRLWSETGYDLTYDNFHPLPNPAYGADNDSDLGAPTDDGTDDEGNPKLTPDGEEFVHSARLFVGYQNEVNEVLSYVGGIEGLVNVEQTSDVRIYFDNALRSSIGGNLQLEIKFILQFDNRPVAGAESLDTQTQVNLIYNLI